MTNVTELRVALTVEDFDQALAFYRDVLGLDQVADWSSAAGRVVVLDAGRAMLQLFDRAQAEAVDAIEAGRRLSGPVRFALRVADSEAVAARLVAAGAERVAPPVTTPWGDHNARVQAPDGMQLTLFNPAEQQSEDGYTELYCWGEDRDLASRRHLRAGHQAGPRAGYQPVRVLRPGRTQLPGSARLAFADSADQRGAASRR